MHISTLIGNLLEHVPSLEWVTASEYHLWNGRTGKCLGLCPLSTICVLCTVMLWVASTWLDDTTIQ
jgi:hypothetical protein